MKFDIPINFEIYSDTEENAVFNLQKFLHQAIIEFGLDREIVEHDVIEFAEADSECHHGGCRDNHNCKGQCV